MTTWSQPNIYGWIARQNQHIFFLENMNASMAVELTTTPLRTSGRSHTVYIRSLSRNPFSKRTFSQLSFSLVENYNKTNYEPRQRRRPS